MNGKLCPLRNFQQCDPKCAWAIYDNNCAIYEIGESIIELKQIEVRKENWR
jgi:hypothetical protein